MNKIITACIIAVYCFSACADKEPDHDDSLMRADSSKPAASIISDSQNFIKPDTSLPGSTQSAITTSPQPVVNQSSSTTAPGMNPPHGQPNHRCDIAVGAPLNSPVTKPAAQTVSTTQASATPAKNTTANTVTPPGMNPPHGQPNHRCDIAVGAPLNSPVTKPSTQTVTPTPVPEIITAPSKKDSGG